MTILYTNNASTTLASGITNSATTLTVASGYGAAFPSPSGSQYFYMTLQSASNSAIREIVKVTARSTDSFTIVRGQDGTTGTAFSTGDLVQLRVTAADLNNFGQLDTSNTWTQTQTMSITGNAGTVTNGVYTTGSYSNPSWLTSILGSIVSGNIPGNAANITGTYTGSISSSQITTGLGYTPYNSSNPSGYLSGTVGVGNGGTGATSFTANYVLLGNGTSAFQTVAPGTSGNVLTSNGTTWVSSAPSGGSGLLLNIQYFTSSGTYTPTSGTTFVVVEVVGGGGGGNNGGGGSAGGTTSFGALVSATGGSTGSSATGGTGSSGDLNLTGGSGSYAQGASKTPGYTTGGSAPMYSAQHSASGGQSITTSVVGTAVNYGHGGGHNGYTSTCYAGAGGGYAKKRITSGFSGVTVTVGGGGSAGSGGAAGTGGICIVYEYK
jgi:hypothetical protein